MKKSCWQHRTTLEIGLICVVLIATGIITTLLILNLRSKESTESTIIPQDDSCDSQTCIKEALQILSRIDIDIDPCKDFYSFACNNIPLVADVNKQYGPFANLLEDSHLKIERMYNEPIQSKDHNLVKIQKRLFQACINETAIEIDAFRTVQATLRAAGGWPVVEGRGWNETGFDWLDVTYKLRQLGYTYSIYLDLNIVPDPRNEEKYIFEISIPEVKDIHNKFFDSDERNGYMADIAIVFGAEVHHAIAEMTETLDFLLDLQWKRNTIANDDTSYRTTVADVQQKHGTINWLEFINRIVGRSARLSANDFILFPSERAMDDWFNTLFKASKRLQANYMMWRVVEETLPYLTQKLLIGKVKPRLMLNTDEERETRSEYCIREVRRRFSPSPIDIMYLRKYIPQDKREEAEELLGNFQTELLEVVRQVDWMDIEDKEDAEERINEVNMVIGAPGDYFDDRIFDDKNYNFDKTQTTNFLKLLSEANRNQKNRLYSLINKPTSDTRLAWWHLYSFLPSYDPVELEIPAPLLQGEVFNENRPHYLNYGIMGLTMKNVLFGNLESPYGWKNKTVQTFLKRLHCLMNDTNVKQIELPNYLLYQPISHLLGWKVSYAAYKNWVEENGEEFQLFATDYTPKQLFWISSGYIFCHYTNPFYDDNLLNTTVKDAYSAIVKRLINNNAEIARDFGCSTGSNTNHHENKCKIF